MVIQQKQLEVVNIFDKLVLQQSDDKGNIKGNTNLTKEQAAGRKKLFELIKTEIYKLYGTDKLEKLELDTEESHMRAMAPHVEGLEVVEYYVVLESKKHLNNYSMLLCRVINLGANAWPDQKVTCSKAMQSYFAPLPQAKGARKDHKTLDPILGYPI